MIGRNGAGVAHHRNMTPRDDAVLSTLVPVRGSPIERIDPDCSAVCVSDVAAQNRSPEPVVNRERTPEDGDDVMWSW